MLKKMSLEHNFALEKINGVSIGSLRVSSSEIRRLLTKGDFKAAETFLGKAFFNKWQSCNGDKLGRTIGFPTANIGIKRKLSPVLGVYSVHIEHNSKTLSWCL